jgi:hypothetical protein
MDVKRAGAGLAATGALILAAVVPAGASPGDILWQGVTLQGVTVKLTVGTAGDAHAFKIGKTESKCKGGGTVSTGTVTYRDLDESDPDGFRDKRRTMSDRGGLHFHTTSRIHGGPDEEPHSWSGTYKLHIRAFRGSETVKSCELETRWSVGRRVGRDPGA